MVNRKQKIVECYDKLRKELKKEERDVVIKGETWKNLMQLMADEFNSISSSASSEADIATNIDSQILSLSSYVFAPSGLHEFELDKERKVNLIKETLGEDNIIHVIKTKGRIDSKYASFVIEYKHPNAYKTTAR